MKLAIVTDIEVEQALMNANRELIERMEKKILGDTKSDMAGRKLKQ